jgi:hypothetical protein
LYSLAAFDSKNWTPREFILLIASVETSFENILHQFIIHFNRALLSVLTAFTSVGHV